MKVAVKLVHPNVKEGVAADMDILRTIAAFIERNPKLKYLSPVDTVEEFAKVERARSGGCNRLFVVVSHLFNR